MCSKRPALSEARLELTDQGMVSDALKTAYRDGTTHVVFEALDFMAKLAALVPKPRTNLTGPPTDDFMEYWRRTVGTERA